MSGFEALPEVVHSVVWPKEGLCPSSEPQGWEAGRGEHGFLPSHLALQVELVKSVIQPERGVASFQGDCSWARVGSPRPHLFGDGLASGQVFVF